MKKNKIITGMLVSLMLVCFSSNHLLAQDANAVLAKVRQKLQSVKNYIGEGDLVTDISFITIPDSKVKVYFRQPDELRILKKDGISILPKGGVNLSLNALVMGKEMVAVPAGYAQHANKKLAVIKLLPVDNQSEIVLNTLLVEEGSGLVYKSTTTTRDNGTYETILEYGKYARWGLPDKLVLVFNTGTFKLPKAVTMEYEGSSKKPVTRPGMEGKGRVTITYSSYTVNQGVPAGIFSK